MKVSAIYNIAKKSLIPLALAGAAAAYASSPIKNNTVDAVQNQTEIVSNAGAEAIKSAAVQNINQKAVHNTKLDNTLRKFITNDEDKKNIEELISTIYDLRGSYFGSAIIQHEIDRRCFFAFISGNTKLLKEKGLNPELGKKIEGFGRDFYKTIDPNGQRALDWLFKDYTPNLMGNLQREEKHTGESMVKTLDDVVLHRSSFTIENKSKYFVWSNDFKNKDLNNRKDAQAMMDLAAYKMFMIDRIMFTKELIGVEITSGEGHFPNLHVYFEEWMDSVMPKAE